MAKPSLPPPPPPARDWFSAVHEFFASGTWVLIRNLGVLVLGIVWLGSVLWTWKDARRRIDDPLLVACALVVGAVPILGTLVYLLLRPPEYLDDVRERRLEIEALEEEIAAAAERVCPTCAVPVQADFLVCPVCVTRLKDGCARCGAPLEALWQACPLCAAPRGVEPPAAKPERPRRPRARAPIALDEHLLGVAQDVPPDAQAEAATETV